MKGNKYLSVADFDGKKSVCVSYDYLLNELNGMLGIINWEEYVRHKGDGAEMMLERIGFFARTLAALKESLLENVKRVKLESEVDAAAPKPPVEVVETAKTSVPEASENDDEVRTAKTSVPEASENDDEVSLDDLNLSDDDLEGLDIDVDLDAAAKKEGAK